MIRYSLRCERDHAFESWFQDSATFDTLSSRGQLGCPECGSADVRKAVMAPSIVRGRSSSPVVDRPAASEPAPPPGPVAQPVALMGEREREMRDMVRKLHRKIVETSDNVGSAFPQEARRMHEGEVPPRPIYGQATGEEVKALLDDGVPLLPIPSLPDEQN